MARKPAKHLTERQLEIMQALWDRPDAHLKDIQAALERNGEPVAPSTVATQLKLLIHKGFLKTAGRRGQFVYQPTCTRAEATQALLDQFLERVGLSGTASHLIGLLETLLKTQKLSAADRAALGNLLRSDRKHKPRRPAKKKAKKARPALLRSVPGPKYSDSDFE